MQRKKNSMNYGLIYASESVELLKKIEDKICKMDALPTNNEIEKESTEETDNVTEAVNGELTDSTVEPEKAVEAAQEEENISSGDAVLDTGINNSKPVVSNVAKRGTKRKIGDTDLKPTRATPRRATRSTRRSYAEEIAYTEVEEEIPDDPDYKMSDSDEDPDFDPTSRPRSPDDESARPKRGRAKGRGRGRQVMCVQPMSATSDVPSTDEPEAIGNGEHSAISDNTVSSTDDNKASSVNLSLSSAYNYAATRTRQNAAIRLPEGPNLTEEQLKQIESQFKSGDFVMAKKDADMIEHPPIWRIDGKSLLQKFQAFDKDGKMLYRNISTYSGWTPQAKALYVPVKVNFVFQSRYDTVVELIGYKGDATAGETNTTDDSATPDKSSWITKSKCFEISDEHRVHMPSFEIYLQTLISQALDNNFLTEIYDENDAYFVDRVKMIDDLTDERKSKILEMAKWDSNFQTSLDTWPCVNTMLTKNTGKCQACNSNDATKLSQFYGQPYDNKTLRSREPTLTDLEFKNFQTCDSCAELSETYNKVCHQKYDYYSQCKSTVTNMRVTQPNKTTTNVLRDLLANDEWITGLFRSMCTMWVKVDGIYENFQAKKSDEEGDQSEETLKENETSNEVSERIEDAESVDESPAVSAVNEEVPNGSDESAAVSAVNEDVPKESDSAENVENIEKSTDLLAKDAERAPSVET